MIKVLVVDDSLFMRRLIADMLNSDPQIEAVDTAKDGVEALKKISKNKPDCITLDLVMPHNDGLNTLRQIMDEHPTPCVILSAHSKKDADITVQCLKAGAVGFVLKPSGELSLDIENVRNQLLKEVKATSQVKVKRIKDLFNRKVRHPGSRLAGFDKIIVIGASTGGPQTLEFICSSLPADFSVPVIIIQHVPARFFTESIAEYLNRISCIKVKLAEDGEKLANRRIYLCPGGSRMSFRKEVNGQIAIELAQDDRSDISPSIDFAMQSAAAVYQDNTLGIILTGIGHDGLEGMKAVKSLGGRTIVQDESSMIFGMPQAVIEAGLADQVFPVQKILEAMVDYASVELGSA